MKAILLILGAGLCFGQADPATPTLPLSIPPSTRPAFSGMVRHVTAGTTAAQLQTLYSTTSSCGDDIQIDKGVTIDTTGVSLIFNKDCSSGSNWIGLESAGCADGSLAKITLPLTTLANYNGAGPPQARPTLTNYATISTTSADVYPFVTTDASYNPAKYHYFCGLEVVLASTNHQYDLILMSSLTGGGETESKLSQLSDHIIFDRMYLHGQPNVANGVQNCVYMQGTNISFVNSYCDNIGAGSESHGLLMGAGGPFYINNNVIIAPNNIFTMGTGTYGPYFVCDVLASPTPTTTTATVANCKAPDGTAAPAPYDIGPPIGTVAMFFLNGGFRDEGSMTISGNTAGALTFGQPHGRTGSLPLPQAPDNSTGGIAVASLPTCNGGSNGTTQQVSNSNTTTRNATVAGGGSNHVGVYCNGTNWNVNDQQNFTITWGFVTHDMTITNNLLYKYPCWNPADPSHAGTCPNSVYAVKDFFETKGSQRVNINGNVMMNTWNGGQSYAFNITNDYWMFSVSTDTTVTNNVVKNISGTFATIVTQPSENGSPNCPANVTRVLFQNNLFFSVNGAANISGSDVLQIPGYNSGSCQGPGGVVGISPGVDSLQVLHNMLIGTTSRSWGFVNSVDSAVSSTFMKYTNYVLKDNIIEFNNNRLLPGSSGINDNQNPKPFAINTYITAGSTNWAWTNNGLINSGVVNNGVPTDATILSNFPGIILSTIYDTTSGLNYAAVPFTNGSAVLADYHNFSLSSGAWVNGASDGTNVGVNFTTLDAALGTGGGGLGGSVTSGKGSRSGKTVTH